MFKSLIDSIKTKPKSKFSLENLHFLYTTLVKNPIIKEDNKNLIIETLRQIAEVMIWGDQHNSDFFDFFLEKNILGFFLKILSQKTNRQVKVQLIQTLSILVENMRAQSSIYYILSNNHVNELITHKFDFSDDELMAYYISLLKTLSLKLNPNTVQFFFNSLENDFPLYTEAIKFFNHRDSMIRIAVRTLTLNVYKVEDEAMRRFVLDKTAAPYFSNIVWFIRDQCATLDSLVNNSTHTNRAKLEDFTAELMDYFYYLHDIFNLGIKELSEVLSDHLIKFLLLPQFVGSLVQDDDGIELEDRLSPLIAVFLLSQVFYIFTYKPLINTVAAALLHPDPSSYSFILQNPISLLETRRMPSKRYSLCDLVKLEADARKEREEKAKKNSFLTASGDRRASLSDPSRKSNKYYESLLSFLSEGDRMVLVVMCLLYALTRNQSIDTILIEISGLYPFRLYKAKQLLEALTTEDEKQKHHHPPSGKPRKHVRSVSLNGIESVTLSSSWVDSHPLAVVAEELGFESESKSTETRIVEGGNGHGSRVDTGERTDEGAERLGSLVESDETTITEELETVETPMASERGQAIGENWEGGRKEGGTPRQVTSSGPTVDEEQLYMCRVMRDFGVSEGEAAGLWGQFMGPIIARAEISQEKVPEQLESKPQEDRNSELREDDIPNESKGSKEVERVIVGDSNEGILESPRDARLKENQSQEEPVAQPGRECTLKDSEGLVEHLLRVLLRSCQCRLITLQMTTLLAKELVYSLDSAPNLTLIHFRLMEEAYLDTTNNLRGCLTSSLSDIFLELFEQELRTFKQINFDGLMADTSSLLLPVAATPLSGIALSKRLPSGEAEKIQKAVQAFLVLRELKYTLLKKKDDKLPFREEEPNAPLQPRDVFTFPSESENSQSLVSCMMPVGPTKKKLQRYLVLDSGCLLIVEPDPRSAPKAKTNPSLPSSGHICNSIPLQNIEMEVDASDEATMHVTSHPTTSQFAFTFESSTDCQSAQQRLEKARNKVRANKMRQIDEMLKDAIT